MRLGSQTNSVVNHLYSRAVIGQPEPVIGMGVTLLGWTDRNPATIIEIFQIGKTQYIACQNDNYVRVDGNGMSESQEYQYSPNPNGSRNVFRIGRNGLWEACALNENGRYVKTSGKGLRLGERERYYDFSF
jgi:hypothetical protein